MRQDQSATVFTWHVYARAVRRLALFYEENDYRHFLMFLEEALILSGCTLFGYVLMGNHYHLMLRGSQAQLTLCMQRLNWRYALFHNDTHCLGGHVFDGPYQRHPQRSLRWMLWRLAYIFLNPVTAELVGNAADYRWSGYRSFMGLPGSPLEVSFPPELLGPDGEKSQARDHFIRVMQAQQSRPRSRSSTAPTARQIQSDQFAWIRAEADTRCLHVREVDKDNLALWWGREAGIPPGVMAKALDLPSGDAVRMRVRRFEGFLKAHPEIASRLSL